METTKQTQAEQRLIRQRQQKLRRRALVREALGCLMFYCAAVLVWVAARVVWHYITH